MAERNAEIEKLMKLFATAELSEVLAIFGHPQSVRLADEYNMTLVWEEIGERTFLIYSLVHGEKLERVRWRTYVPTKEKKKAIKGWPVAMTPGSFHAVSPREGNSLEWKARFHFKEYPQVTWTATVAGVMSSGTVYANDIAQLMPSADRKKLFQILRQNLPSAQEVGEAARERGYLFAAEAAEHLASLEVPGSYSLSWGTVRCVYSREESPDGYRGPYSYVSSKSALFLAWGIGPERFQKQVDQSLPLEAAYESLLQEARRVFEEALGQIGMYASRHMGWPKEEVAAYEMACAAEIEKVRQSMRQLLAEKIEARKALQAKEK